MTMYRIQAGEHRLQRFRSTEFGSRYHEKDLEDWLELNPEVLTDGEPILIIGRQVTTTLGGTLDLLGLDADGATVVIELKRAPTPRDIVAQALEYATWVASLDGDKIQQLARNYLAAKISSTSLEEVWRQAFGNGVEVEADASSALPADLRLNERQRVVMAIEGANERVTAVIKYLRSLGMDIGLLEYRYYQTEEGEQILDIEVAVGREQAVSSTGAPTRYTEERLLGDWTEEGKDAYLAFRNRLLDDEQIVIAPQKSAISFYKQTRDGRVFICFFRAAGHVNRVSLRLDSLQGLLDMEVTLQAIRSAVAPDVRINSGSTWCVLHFPAPRERTLEIAEIIIEHIVSKIQ